MGLLGPPGGCTGLDDWHQAFWEGAGLLEPAAAVGEFDCQWAWTAPCTSGGHAMPSKAPRLGKESAKVRV